MSTDDIGGPAFFETDAPVAEHVGRRGYEPELTLDDGGYICTRCKRTKADAQVNGCGQPGNGAACPMEPTSAVLFTNGLAISLPIRKVDPNLIRIYNPTTGEVTYERVRPHRKALVNTDIVILVGSMLIALAAMIGAAHGMCR